MVGAHLRYHFIQSTAPPLINLLDVGGGGRLLAYFFFRVFQRDCLACRRAGQSAIRASSNSSRTPSPHSVETAVLRTLAERCEARLMSGCAPIFSTVLDRSQRYQRPYWEQEYGSGLLCFAIIHGRVVRDPSFLLYRTIVQNAAVLETLF